MAHLPAEACQTDLGGLLLTERDYGGLRGTERTEEAEGTEKD